MGVALGLATLAALAVGCDILVTPFAPHEPLAWRLDPAFPVAPDTQRLHVVVEVPTCAFGPAEVSSAVEYRETEVAISTRRPGLPPGMGRCLLGPGFYALEIHLAEPVGSRRIVSLDQPPPPTLAPANPRDPTETWRVEYPSSAP